MPRSRRIPHLEYRRSGYVWRRRWPKSLSERWSDSEPSESAIEPNPLVFKSSRRESGPIGENPYSKLAFRGAAIENASKSGAASSRSNGGIPSLVFSLKTHAFSEAQELSIRLTALSNLTFHYIASTMTLTPAVVTHVLTTLVRFEIEAAYRIRIQGDQRTPEAAEFALRRERGLQETLRQALQLRNHEVARRPLQAVSQHLGITLPEHGDDWKSLAYEATRVLLNVSEERERRERGLFHEPSPYFSQGIGQSAQGIAPSAAVSVGIGQGARFSPQMRQTRWLQLRSVADSRDDARDIFDQLSPLPGTPLADGNEEIKRRTDQFVAATAEFELDYVSSAISDVEDAGFSSTTSFAEGAKTRKTHLVIERNGKIREAFFKANPSAVCDFCGMDTGGSFPWTNRILDVHYLLPLCSGERHRRRHTNGGAK